MQNNSGKTPYVILEFGTVLHKHNFNVVKQQNKVHYVNLHIFPPHLHIKFV
jgi:hypothetical protein